jgi:hypothetical protein
VFSLAENEHSSQVSLTCNGNLKLNWKHFENFIIWSNKAHSNAYPPTTYVDEKFVGAHIKTDTIMMFTHQQGKGNDAKQNNRAS